MTVIPPSDPTIRRSGYTNTAPAISTPPVTPGASTPVTPAAASSESPAQIATPSSFEGTPGVGQGAGFNPITADIFKKIGQADALAAQTELAPAQRDPELAAIVQRFKEAMAEISPPPDSPLARIVNQFKAVVDKLAEKLEKGQDTPATAPSSSESTPAPADEPTAEPAATTSEAPSAPSTPEAPAEPTAPESTPEPASSEPAVAEALTEADAAETETEIASAEPSESESTDETGGSDGPTGGTAPTSPESPKETDNPAVKDPQEMLKGSIEELLAMFQKKRLEEQLSAFGEEQLQKMREALNQAAKVLRGMP
jgi:hypothetical protein